MSGRIDLGRVVGIDGQGVPTGGTTGQYLQKRSAANHDTTWGTPNAASPESIAIVANGNTHAAIPAGQFVYVRNHSSLSEGLYQATAAIATNATLSTSNLTAVSGGGLNAIGGILKTPGMFNKLTVTVTTTELGNAVFTELRASNIIVGIRPPEGVICAGIGRSANGWPLARIADTANNVLTETEVTLDIYYI